MSYQQNDAANDDIHSFGSTPTATENVPPQSVPLQPSPSIQKFPSQSGVIAEVASSDLRPFERFYKAVVDKGIMDFSKRTDIEACKFVYGSFRSDQAVYFIKMQSSVTAVFTVDGEVHDALMFPTELQSAANCASKDRYYVKLELPEDQYFDISSNMERCKRLLEQSSDIMDCLKSYTKQNFINVTTMGKF